MYSFSNLYNYSKELNILYVEDNLELLESTQDLFESFFNTVSVALDGQEGLDKYIQYHTDTNKYYDLIITDINMPKINGIELIKQIKQINFEQSIIVISAYNDADNLIALLREGISNFITKPIMPDQLVNILTKTSKEIHNEKMKHEFFIGQAKLACMGEMIDTIAHQWQTPVSIIKMQAQLLESDLEDNLIDKEDMHECIEKQKIQIEHLVATLHQFRSFFRPSTEEKIVSCKVLIDTALTLIKDNLISNHVNIDVHIDNTLNVKVIQNEFIHVIINIIHNAIDEFKNKKIVHPNITIRCYKENEFAKIEILDNAGGIPTDILSEIFKANFTTKKSTNGTGIGLYLVSLILQKINATIEVANKNDGARFTICMKEYNSTI